MVGLRCSGRQACSEPDPSYCLLDAPLYPPDRFKMYLWEPLRREIRDLVSPCDRGPHVDFLLSPLSILRMLKFSNYTTNSPCEVEGQTPYFYRLP